eukprot:3021898-Pleurochrysis_carterae.AAC.1
MRCCRGADVLQGTLGCNRTIWAWSRSCHRSARPRDWTMRGSTRPSSSSVSINRRGRGCVTH